MTDDEIREFVVRLERAAEFRAAKSHVEELAIRDCLRVRANRDACFSMAAAFLLEAIQPTERRELMPANCQVFAGHEQVISGLSSKQIVDIRLFSNWDNLETILRKGRRADQVRDRVSLIGCALGICVVLIPVAGFFAWLLQ